jgi:hypothetical protein
MYAQAYRAGPVKAKSCELSVTLKNTEYVIPVNYYDTIVLSLSPPSCHLFPFSLLIYRQFDLSQSSSP